MRAPLSFFAILAGLLAALSPAPGAEGARMTAAEAARQAALAYEEGRCSQVLGIFATLDEAGAAQLDGVSHYRWGFCLGRLGQGSPLDQYREAARKLAVAAQQEGAPVDAHFYRVNALLNLDQGEPAREAARLAVGRWKEGELTVPEDDGRAWFRLGKLHRDAGQAGDAQEPFSRSLALHVSGRSPLNEAYLQRIADGLRAAGDDAGALRALGALQALRPADPSSTLREARTLLAGGDLEGARKLAQKARAGSGDTPMLAQYTYFSIARIQELGGWDLAPAETLADGTPIVHADLRAELRATAREAFRVFQGPAVDLPRKRDKTKTRPAPAPEVLEEMRITQAIFAGLLREAILQGAPLREWAVADGYAPLIHHPWRKLFRDQVKKRRAEEAKGADAGDGSAR